MITINNQLLQLPIEEVEEEIAKLIGLGYTHLILTFPALIDGEYEIEDMVTKFNMFKLNFKGINLHLGSELNYHYSIIHRLKKRDVLTLDQSEYILLRLPKEEKPEQFKQLIMALSSYRIILSCVEDYKYFSIDELEEMKDMGILYLSNIKNIGKKKVKKLLKRKLIDYLCFYDDIDAFDEKLKNRFGNAYINQITKDNFCKILKIDL